MYKVSYGVREVLMGEITKTSKAVVPRGGCWGKRQASFACDNGNLSRSGVIESSSAIYWAVSSRKHNCFCGKGAK
jgi:hypothetical protein